MLVATRPNVATFALDVNFPALLSSSIVISCVAGPNSLTGDGVESVIENF